MEGDKEPQDVLRYIAEKGARVEKATTYYKYQR
jgi:hypothetical protein